MRVLSLFDGISCGRIALERAGVHVEQYFSSEIKPYAIKAADKNWPQDTPNRLGDITKIDAAQLPEIDLLIGGSPCQDFSGANKARLGPEGLKSRLFFEYVRLWKECKPKYFLLENVRMKKEHEDFVTSVMGVKPIVINSALVAPQTRHRLYWTNIPVDGLPKNKNLKLNDFLESGYSPKAKANALLESNSRPLATPLKMAHRGFTTGLTTLIFKSKEHFDAVKAHFGLNFKGKSAKEIDRLASGMDLSIYNGLRYMTATERERCQTIPQGYTDSLTQNQAACVLGDGWTVDIIAHILGHLPRK